MTIRPELLIEQALTQLERLQANTQRLETKCEAIWNNTHILGHAIKKHGFDDMLIGDAIEIYAKEMILAEDLAEETMKEPT